MVVGAEARGAWGYAPPGSPFSLDLPGPSGPHDGFWLPCPLAMDTTHPCSWPLLGGSEGGGSGGGGSSPGSSSCRGAGDFDVSFGPPVPSGGPPRTTLPPAGISSGGVPGFMISTPSTLSPHASSCPSSVHRLNSSQSSPSWASVSTYTPSLVPSGSMVMPRPEWTFTRMPSSRTAMTTPSTTQMSEVPSSLTRTAKAVPFTEAVAVGAGVKGFGAGRTDIDGAAQDVQRGELLGRGRSSGDEERRHDRGHQRHAPHEDPKAPPHHDARPPFLFLRSGGSVGHG